MIAISRRQLLKASLGTAAIASLPVGRAKAAPLKPLPMPLSYSGMFSDIIENCASYYGTTPEAVHSPSRERPVVRARQASMYIAVRLTGRSLPEIGRRIGCRDHTTVLHANRKITALVAQDPAERRTMTYLTDSCLRIARLRMDAGVPVGRYHG